MAVRARTYEEGGAFKRPIVPEHQPSASKKEAEEAGPPKSNERAKYSWSSKPSFRDQLLTNPDSCRRGKKTSAVFNLAVKADLAEWNKLLAKTEPMEAPELLFLDTDRNFSESAGGYLVYVEYCTVEYAQLKPTPV